MRPPRRRAASPTTTPISSAASAACAGSTATRPTLRHPRRADRGGRRRRRRLVGGGGAGAQRRRRADADRPGPRRRIEHQPPGAGARQHRRHGQGRGAARAHRRHPPGLRRPRGRGIRRRRPTGPALLPRGGRRASSMPATRCRAKVAMAAWALATRACRSSPSARPAASAARSGWRSTTWRRRRTIRCWRRCASGCASTTARRKSGAIGIACVFSREPVVLPAGESEGCDVDGTLNCHGYGSSVSVTATFGLVAATRALESPRSRPTDRAFPPPYNHGLGGLLAQLVEQRTFNP